MGNGPEPAYFHRLRLQPKSPAPAGSTTLHISQSISAVISIDQLYEFLSCQPTNQSSSLMLSNQLEQLSCQLTNLTSSQVSRPIRTALSGHRTNQICLPIRAAHPSLSTNQSSSNSYQCRTFLLQVLDCQWRQSLLDSMISCAQCCGAGPFLTGSEYRYLFHRLRLL